MSPTPEPVYQLKCSCNSYPWGKTGSDSLSARLCQNQPGYLSTDHPDSAFQVDEAKPYAEMWLGTYPVLPSYTISTNEDLQALLDRHPKELIGENVLNKFGHTKLPFLPKILSISKALPLQLHPDKDLAAKLHAENPSDFTDPNHKPEIALALTNFEAFIGFRPLPQIASLMALSPLKRFLPSSYSAPEAQFTDETLKHIVHTMLITDSDSIRETYNFLTHISPATFAELGAPHIPSLAPRLAQQYDATDPGILVALVTMNYLTLSPGDAVYIPADGIHAYLSGDIVECMARSDNVLNTGFCPRSERSNVDLFTSCLTFRPHSEGECMLPSETWGKGRKGRTTVYKPPLSEFNVLRVELEKGDGEELGAVDGPSVVVVTSGDGKLRASGGKDVDLREGSALFVAHGVEIEVEAGDRGMEMCSFFVE